MSTLLKKLKTGTSLHRRHSRMSSTIYFPIKSRSNMEPHPPSSKPNLLHRYRPALIAVIGVIIAQQLTGINSVMIYSVELLSTTFPTSATAPLFPRLLDNFLTTIACAPLPDILGRKPTLLLSITGMGLLSLSLAFSLLFNIAILSAISAIFFVAFFGVGVGAIPFILAAELVDQEASSATQGWGLAANWCATFSNAQFCPMINDALNERFGGSGWVNFVFAAFALICGLFVVWKCG